MKMKMMMIKMVMKLRHPNLPSPKLRRSPRPRASPKWPPRRSSLVMCQLAVGLPHCPGMAGHTSSSQLLTSLRLFCVLIDLVGSKPIPFLILVFDSNLPVTSRRNLGRGDMGIGSKAANLYLVLGPCVLTLGMDSNHNFVWLKRLRQVFATRFYH